LEELVPLSIQIVRFKIAALRRKTVRRGEHTSVSVDEMPIPDERPDPAQQAERREFLERLNTAAAQLGDRCKEMLRMKLQGLSFPEIQKVLGVRSINTIYTWDHRCRQHLLELLERKR
jgi:RNA polymerase sigma-70 factor (ECF subfamily)